MLRNIVVTGVVSLIMGGFTLAYLFLVPAPPQPSMGGQASSGQAGTMGGQEMQAPSQSSMGGQPSSPQAGQMGGMGGMGGGMMGMCGSMMKMMMGGGKMGGTSGMPKGQSMGGMMGMCPMMGMMGMMGMGQRNQPQTGTTGQRNQPGASAVPLSKPLTEGQAKDRAENFLKSLGNPNLKLGTVKATDSSYEIDVTTKDNSLVNRLILDKKTGAMRTQY